MIIFVLPNLKTQFLLNLTKNFILHIFIFVNLYCIFSSRSEASVYKLSVGQGPDIVCDLCLCDSQALFLMFLQPSHPSHTNCEALFYFTNKTYFCNKMAYFIKKNKTEGTTLTIIIVYENLRTKGLSLPLSQTMVPDDQDNLELASIMCLS